MTASFSETDLASPIKKYFEKKGYRVMSEVKGCDLTATKEDELIIVELKKSLNVTLLYQAMERQKLTNHVYVAIPRPKNKKNNTFFKAVQLLKKLDIGLLTVAIDSPVKTVEEYVEPMSTKTPPNTHKRKAVIKEIAGRTNDANVGGSSRKKLLTAFRERCIKVACILEKHGAMSGRQLVKHFGLEKDVTQLMYRNEYGWFKRLGKGSYDLSSHGKNALDDTEFQEIILYYRETFLNKGELNGKI